MIFDLVINGKELEVDVPSTLRLSVLLRDVLNRKSVKHNCGCGKCGFCLILLDDKPVYSCLIPAYKAQNKNILTIEGISQRNEFNNIVKGFELANVDLCPNCGPSRILLTYYHLEKSRELTSEAIDNIIESINCNCTSQRGLKEGLYLAANFYEGGNI